MIELLQVSASSGLLLVLALGFAPRLVLRFVLLGFKPEDPRRRELSAELAAIPRRDRPFWVAEQLEVALIEGLLPRLVEHVLPHRAEVWSFGVTSAWPPIKPGDPMLLAMRGAPAQLASGRVARAIRRCRRLVLVDLGYQGPSRWPLAGVRVVWLTGHRHIVMTSTEMVVLAQMLRAGSHAAQQKQEFHACIELSNRI